MNLTLLFPMHLREAMKNLEKLQDLEEIRIRIGQPIFVYTQKEELLLVSKGKKGAMEIEKTFRNSKEQGAYENAYRTTEQDLLEMQNYISNYSLYAWQEELRNGFLTVSGGHRIGICGGATIQGGRMSGISYLTFFNIRVAHEKIGCADGILPYIYCSKESNFNGANVRNAELDLALGVHNTLFISSPGMGKTTLLRDCIRSISHGGMKIGLVDERSEIAASYHGIPQNDIGPRTDVLDGCKKPEGILLLLRTMAPEIIAVDELGTEEDFKAVEQAAYSGCKILGTVHAGSMKELLEKPMLQKWCEKELFERFVLIEKGELGVRKYKVYNHRWELLC